MASIYQQDLENSVTNQPKDLKSQVSISMEICTRYCLDAITKLLGAYDSYADQDDTISNVTSANNVVNYFTKAIISVGEHAFLLLSVEAYERDAFKDVHSEKTASTFPEAISANTRRYRHTTLAYKEEFDGRDTVKFVIGLKHCNLLLTGICDINTLGVNFGSSCLSKYATHHDINDYIIFIKKARAPLQDSTIQACRQLSSQFEHKSTYHPYRGNLFEDIKLQPATIFTGITICTIED